MEIKSRQVISILRCRTNNLALAKCILSMYKKMSAAQGQNKKFFFFNQTANFVLFRAILSTTRIVHFFFIFQTDVQLDILYI